MQITDTKPLIIMDTSVLLKWFVKEEEDIEQVQILKTRFAKKDFKVLVPALTGWELNNYFGREFSKEEAIQHFNDYRSLQFTETMLSLEISYLAFKIMKKCPGVSFYDASYHALALHYSGLYLTADKKHYEKSKSFGHIQLLKDYK